MKDEGKIIKNEIAGILFNVTWDSGELMKNQEKQVEDILSWHTQQLAELAKGEFTKEKILSILDDNLECKDDDVIGCHINGRNLSAEIIYDLASAKIAGLKRENERYKEALVKIIKIFEEIAYPKIPKSPIVDIAQQALEDK